MVPSDATPNTDHGSLLRGLMDESAYVGQVLPLFREEPELSLELVEALEADGEALHAAIALGQGPQIAHSAHRLVSSAGGLAASKLAETARRIDQCWRRGDASGAAACYEAAQILIAASVQELRTRLVSQQ